MRCSKLGEKVCIKNFTLSELEKLMIDWGERPFRARQIFHHLYVRLIGSWDQCTDLSNNLRREIKEAFHLEAISFISKLTSSDGTEKFLFKLPDGYAVESVLIPDPPRYTLCLSTQVGCPLKCSFCYTGSLGFKRNLKAGEIVDQYVQVQQLSKNRITNVVFMGMGEPLLNEAELFRALEILLEPRGINLSHRRITLSTVGIIPAMDRLGKHYPVNLAVSLHAPRDDLRSDLMPINRTYSLEPLIEACIKYPLPPRKRITFEYVLIDGVNDSPREAKELSELVRPLRCKINLIPYNPHEGAKYRRPSEAKVNEFQAILQKAHITATIRESRGIDIQAACGQLAGSLRRFSTNIPSHTHHALTKGE
ncbi:MAG: 23S rRNA (adenine(2503)-C(2))-methyltransferase RlmN [Syntrophobacterales bacterium]|nr:23S rRNA (adenine(2503)-C(2))-methyltransferase RlmN [Syntrophobacterales bacterium]